MPTTADIAESLANAMPDELKVALYRLAERNDFSLEETIVSFLSEGVTTHPQFLGSFAGRE